MPLKLFHTPATRSLRVVWLLEEMGVEYDLHSMKYDGAYFASDEYRKINPMGKVPALYDGENLVAESIAIMQYVMERFGPTPLNVSADNPEFGTYLQWLHMAESGMANYIAVSFGHSFQIDPYKVTDKFDEYCRYQITKAQEMLDELLVDREYLLKTGFSAADISLGYTLFFASMGAGIKLTDTVQAYYDRLMARPAAQKAIADIKR